MLKIIRNIREISFSEYMQVYAQSNAESGKRNYPHDSAGQQIIQAENDLYAYLCEMFRTDRKAICAVWEVQGAYKAALRLEEYRDGLLLNSLETAPDARRRGFAYSLVRTLLEVYPASRIYSHIHKDNLPSIALHEKCGFMKISDRAVLLDGSICPDNFTYCYTLSVE